MMSKFRVKRSIAQLLCFVLLLTAVLPSLTTVSSALADSAFNNNAQASGSVAAKHVYTLKNLPIASAVQNFSIQGNYIYATQRSGTTTYLTKLLINKTGSEPYDANYESHMTITGAGYGETLDCYTYGGKTYFLMGVSSPNDNGDSWSTQIGRVTYTANVSCAYTNTTYIRRFTQMHLAALISDETQYVYNQYFKDSGGDNFIDRVNAAVGDTYTFFRVQMVIVDEAGETNTVIVYSKFYTSNLNAILDSNTTYSFKTGPSSTHKNAHVDSFVHQEAKGNIIAPNKGFQGMEVGLNNKIYVAGGNDGEVPTVARFSSRDNYEYKCTITGFGNYEIQGLHYEGSTNRMYFASTTGGSANKSNQKIYSASTCLLGYGSHSSADKIGYAETCTTAGRTNGTYCTRCGDILSGYEEVPALKHSFNSGTVTQAASGMTDGTMTIACTRGDHSFTVPIPSVNIPLSYAKPLQANILNEVAYSNGSNTTVMGAQLTSLSFEDSADQSIATAELYDSSGGSTPNCLLFKPTAMLSKIIRINSNISATVAHTTSGVSYSIPVTMPVPIQIIPATSVYYETDFSSSAFTQEMKGTSNTWSTSDTTQEEYQCWDSASSEPVYGYDASYADDSGLSNGSALCIDGEGVPMLVSDAEGNRYINFDGAEKYTGISFSFIGTGFDIISRTGPSQGALRVVVCDATGAVKQVISVVNKGNTDLYQIPVVSAEFDTHGAYTVHIFVNAAYDFSSREDGAPDGDADDFGGALDRGGEFFFDAVRIYNPIDTTATDADSSYAYALYQSHGEADPTFTEVRQMLIDASKDTSSEVMEGVVYLNATGGTTSQIAEYTALGPNNEVYLAPGNAIAFKLEVTGTIPGSIDIGAKCANGTPVSMTASIGSDTTSTTTISTATLQYYPLEIASSQWQSSDGKNYVSVTVSNSGESGILSITDIKYAYGVPVTTTTEEIRSVRFLVDRDVLPPVDEKSNVDENIHLGEQLSLENDLTMSFRLDPALIAAYDISTLYIEVERDIYGSDGSTEVRREILDEYVDDGNRLVFRLTGISAAQMNDAIRVTLHIKDAEGKEYVSPVRNTSVTAYLRGLLVAMPTGHDKLYTLIMDMLNYGTAAQVYFGRHADAPANEAYEIFKQYESYASADLCAPLEDLSGMTENASATGKLNLTIDLGTRIGITYKVTLPEGVDAADAKLVIKDAQGNELETLAVADNPTDDRGRYIVNFCGSTSRDMRRVVYATAYANGTAITATYAYSISSYAWDAQENASQIPAELVNIARAMILYGDSAAAYFG